MSQLDMQGPALADRRMREWFVREKTVRESQRREAEPKLVPERSVVTISRQFGAGGHTVAALVAAHLGPSWQIWDREIVDAIAENANVHKEMVEALDEHSHTVVEQMLRGISKSYPLSEQEYHNKLISVLISIAHQGEKIIIGRGANFVLQHALNVRLVASTDYRVRVLEAREGSSHADAAAKLRGIDFERAAYIRHIFGQDVDDPSGYDLILRMDGISAETAAAAIVAAVHQHLLEANGKRP